MIWIAVAFCVFAVIGSTAFATARAWRLWKTIRSTASAANYEVNRVMSAADAAEKRSVSLTAGTERLSTAITHLQGSLQDLAVIRAAADEPRRLLASIRGLVPRK